MSLLSGCIADPETAVDFRALEDEESQIQSIFAEALLLKKQCRQLTMQLTEQESHFHREVTRLQRQVKERDSQLLQMEMEAENEYELKMQSLAKKEEDSTREVIDLKRRLNDITNEAALSGNIMLGLQSRIKALEAELQAEYNDREAAAAAAAAAAAEAIRVHQQNQQQQCDSGTQTDPEVSSPAKMSSNNNDKEAGEQARQLKSLRASTAKLIKQIRCISLLRHRQQQQQSGSGGSGVSLD
jgi:hypothetical protein